MYHFRTNPPARQIAPRPVLLPTARRSPLLRKIETYLQATGMAPSAFGRLACKDPQLVSDLRRGREPGAGVVAKVERIFAITGGGYDA